MVISLNLLVANLTQYFEIIAIRFKDKKRMGGNVKNDEVCNVIA